MTGYLTMVRVSMRIQRADVMSPIIMAVLPLILTPFLLPGAQAQLQAAGFPDATGVEQVVPGFAALFGFLAVQQIVTGFARDHEWGTWWRLRAAPVSAVALMLGRSTCCLLIQLAQLAFVMTAGSLLFGYRPKGSLLAVCLVMFALAVLLVAFGVMLVTVFASPEHALVAASLGAMVMAGVGGALSPVSTFPQWAQVAAHASPAYWALDAMRTLTLTPSGLGDVAIALLAMTGFTVAFGLVAVLRFRPAQRKAGLS